MLGLWIRICQTLFALGIVLLLAACQKGDSPTAKDQTGSALTTNIYEVKGLIKELLPDGVTARIQHEEIPGYMPAMTMPLAVKDPQEWRGLKAGDPISFRMLVTEDDGWIDRVAKLDIALPASPPPRPTTRIVRDVEPLEVGAMLPEYQFTNELGQAISTAQFKGKALAFTFIFTRCPFPLFCPLMSKNFTEAQNKLKSMPGTPTNWHLLTISFDPDFDTPQVLKGYSRQYEADPARWSFATGALIDVTAIGEQFGLTFWTDSGLINHNLRTVVIDASGRVQKIFTDNKWTTDELVEEIVRAARVPPVN